MKCETAVLQNEMEFSWFTDILKREKVTSYLEIGGKHGGSLWRAARALPGGSRVVSVDLPHGDTSFKDSQPNLEACVDALSKMGYNAHLILGDSTDPEIIEKVRAFGSFDAVFIDGGHALATVRSDWENYGKLGRIVGFHDIAWLQRPTKKTPIEVPIVWNELKTQYRHEEIKLEPQDQGIGVLWRS